ncbi:MAG: triose-phosphate isomerase [Alphaproteobacteria bacterium]|nr:triose-phosphate isomerase [Alphaproteobacteria bacterium]
MRTLIIGNWKMHGSRASAGALAEACAGLLGHVVLCPPFTLLDVVAQALKSSSVALGAQDCHFAAQGAFTGDISAEMLKDAGCAYVILGHSERRGGWGETDAMVGMKATAAIEAGLIPVICIGETLEEKDAGKTLARVESQLRQSLPAAAMAENTVIAYEPVWAIGTGRTPTLEDIKTVHQHILDILVGIWHCSPAHCRVLYGGSVKAANAGEILAVPGVGGALVGGASLDAGEFAGIVSSVKVAHA